MAQSVFGWGPLVALGLIVLISTATGHCQLNERNKSLLNEGLFVLWVANVVIILYTFFASIYIGPGFVPLKWKPKRESDIQNVTYCHTCEGYKAPRSHHCSQCGRCVKVLDHHCPWINSCVGNDNKVYFLMFVTSVPIGCTYSGIKCILFLFRYYSTMFSWQHRRFYNYQMTPGEFAFVICGGAAAIGVAIAVAMLAAIQIRSILSNMTDMESWIASKAARMRKQKFKFPYNLGWRENIKEVVRQSMRRDGINWRVRDGCTLYDMSIAQLDQKWAHTRLRYTFNVTTRPGRCGCRIGIRTCLSRPWTEGTIDLEPGELVQAWRQRGRWYFGERVRVQDGLIKTVYPLHRGWFPKACVEEEEELDLPFDYRGDGKYLKPIPASDTEDEAEGDRGDEGRARGSSRQPTPAEPEVKKRK